MESNIAALAENAEVAPHIQDDFDIPSEAAAKGDIEDMDAVEAKVSRRVNSTVVKILQQPRQGKKLLVLDIDYTLFDLGSSAERPEELARPYLHHFLENAYKHYDVRETVGRDPHAKPHLACRIHPAIRAVRLSTPNAPPQIAIWSATSMKWVEVKMRELGVSTHPSYKLTFMLDCASMVTVRHRRYGLFDCKPLAYVWAKFPGVYTPDNTIMMDDLRRNYVLNPQVRDGRDSDHFFDVLALLIQHAFVPCFTERSGNSCLPPLAPQSGSRPRAAVSHRVPLAHCRAPLPREPGPRRLGARRAPPDLRDTGGAPSSGRAGAAAGELNGTFRIRTVTARWRVGGCTSCRPRRSCFSNAPCPYFLCVL